MVSKKNYFCTILKRNLQCYEPDEYITLYKASKDIKLNDAKVYGAEIFYDDDSLKLGKIEEKFSDFQEYFEDFLILADED